MHRWYCVLIVAACLAAPVLLAIPRAASPITVAPGAASNLGVVRGATPGSPAPGRGVPREISRYPGLSPLSPIAAIVSLMSAYERMDLESYAALLTADYHFDSDDSELAGSELTREAEIAAADHLFHGMPPTGTGTRPAARSISVRTGSWSTTARVEPGQSSPREAMVMARDVVLEIEFADGSAICTGPTLQCFEVVRGDRAVLPPGAHGDTLHYFVRRWSECTRGSCERALALAAGGVSTSGEPDAGRTRAAPDSASTQVREEVARRDSLALAAPHRVLTLRPTENPCRSELRMALSIPGPESARLEVFDVTGRRIAARDLDAGAPRTLVLTIGSRELRAGVYWLRLRQGMRSVNSRVVLVP